MIKPPTIHVIRILVLWMVGVVSTSTFAQIKFDVQVSDKHLQKAERAKDVRTKLNTYRKYYHKDSIKAARRAWKDYRNTHRDSLKAIGQWTAAKTDQKGILTGQWDQRKQELEKRQQWIQQARAYQQARIQNIRQQDSLGTYVPTTYDSLDLSLSALAAQGDFEQIQTFYHDYAQYDSSYLAHFHQDSIRLDSTTLVERFRLKEHIRQHLPEELAQQTEHDLSKQIQYGDIGPYGQLQHVDRSGVRDFFKNVSPEEFSKSQLTAHALKKKYLTLPDLEKKEEGIKKKSLEGTPLREHLYWGGEITVPATDPVTLHADLRTGYRFTKTYSAGVGFLYREQFGKPANGNTTGDGYGSTLFTTYKLSHGLFAHTEYQVLNNRSLFHKNTRTTHWQHALLIGGGRFFHFSDKVRGTVTALYDLRHRHNTLSSGPLQVRFGYRVQF